MSESHDWVYNYFNYYTEIEEHFQRVRGTAMFRLSSLDWALAETMIALGQAPIAIVAAGDWNRFVVEPGLPSGPRWA